VFVILTVLSATAVYAVSKPMGKSPVDQVESRGDRAEDEKSL
jgi:hypothetical protein